MTTHASVQASVQPLVHSRWWGPLAFVAMVLLLVAEIAPWPAWETTFKYAQRILILTGIAIYARHGFRMRLGVWTSLSWWRFAASVIVSLAGPALMLAMSAGVDNGSAWVGEGRSMMRLTIALAALAVAVVGTSMFVGAMHRFATDPPGSQYDSRLARLWRAFLSHD